MNLGSQTAAFTLNANSLHIGGAPLSKIPSTLPLEARVALPSCQEAPKFVTYNQIIEPAPTVNLQTQTKQSNEIVFGNEILFILNVFHSLFY